MKCDVAKIRYLIATTGKDEAEFLHSVGLGAKTLSRWENGTETPREDFVGFIARKLGVNISEFASCEENESAQAIQKPQTSWQNKKKRTASNNTDDTKTNNPPIIADAKSDLIYISRYQASEQREVWVNKFKSRFSEKKIY